MLRRLLGLRNDTDRAVASELYETIVAAARQPFLYEEFGAPDTPLGRFEMVALHMVLFLRRIRGEPLDALGQRLTHDFFRDMDHSLRELGIGDMGVPKRMKKLARMFYGRAKSYTEALDAEDVSILADALRRNVRPDIEIWPEAAGLASYMMKAADTLARQPVETIAAGAISFDIPLGKLHER